jgi:hypothetical protein
MRRLLLLTVLLYLVTWFCGNSMQILSIEQGKEYVKSNNQLHILQCLAASQSDSSKRKNSHRHIVLPASGAIDDNAVKIAPTVQSSFHFSPAKPVFLNATIQAIISPASTCRKYLLSLYTAAIFETTNLFLFDCSQNLFQRVVLTF